MKQVSKVGIAIKCKPQDYLSLWLSVGLQISLDGLTLGSIFGSYKNLNLKLTEDFLFLIWMSIYAACKILILLFVLNRRYSCKIRSCSKFMGSVVILALVSQVELVNEYLTRINRTDLEKTLGGRYLLDQLHVTIAILYCELLSTVLCKRVGVCELIICLFASFRRPYQSRQMAGDFIAGVLSLACLLLVRRIEKIPSIRVTHAPRSSDSSLEKSGLFPKALPNEATAPLLVPRSHQASLSMISKAKSAQSIKVHVAVSGSDSERVNHQLMDCDGVDFRTRQGSESLPGFDGQFEYMIVIDRSSGKVVSAGSNTLDRKLNDLYSSLRRAVESNRPLETCLPATFAPASDSPNLQASAAQDEQLWRIGADGFDFLKKKVVIFPAHNTLQQLIEGLNEEYQLTGPEQQPFEELINRATVRLKKSKTTTTRQRLPSTVGEKDFKLYLTVGQSDLDCQPIEEIESSLIKHGMDLGKRYSLEFDFDLKFRSLVTKSQSLKFELLNSPKAANKKGDEERPEKLVVFSARLVPREIHSELGELVKVEYHIFLRRIEKTKLSSGTQMLNFISHEMRSPLLASVGFIKLFIKEAQNFPFGEDKAFRTLVNKHLLICESNMLNLMEACNVILDLYKSGMGKVIKGGEFDLRKLIVDTLRVFTFELSKNQNRKLLVRFFDEEKKDFMELLRKQEQFISQIEISSGKHIAVANKAAQNEAFYLRLNQKMDYLGEKFRSIKNSLSHKDVHSLLEEKKPLDSSAQVPTSSSRDWLKSDPTRIKQILVNLVSNAMKYTVNGSVTVHVEEVIEDTPKGKKGFQRKERSIKISVIDTGIGIKEADLKKLFKEFGRISNEMDEMLNSGGIGLGLLLSNKMSKQLSPKNRQNGIEVKSTEHQGSVFSFYIKDLFKFDFERDILTMNDPKRLAGDATSMAHKFKNSDIKEGDQKAILGLEANYALVRQIAQNNVVCIVDDSEINLEILMDMLDNLSFKVRACSNPSEALENIRNKYTIPCDKCKTFNMLIVDFEMPIMTGAELAKKVREIGPEYREVPIICASAQEIDLSEEQNRVFTNQLVKPISMENIIEIMRMYLKSAESHFCKYQSAVKETSSKLPQKLQRISESQVHSQLNDTSSVGSLEERHARDPGIDLYRFNVHPNSQRMRNNPNTESTLEAKQKKNSYFK